MSSDRPAGVVSLTCYPVKSLGGERLDAVDLDLRGVVGDRRWAVTDADGRLGSQKNSRRFRRMDGLLDLTAAYDGPVPVVAFPGGQVVRGDDEQVHAALSEHVGRPVRLTEETDTPHHDDGPLHLVTTASLARLAAVRGRPVDVRRMRANLVVDAGDGAPVEEDAWTGRRLALGEAVLAVREPMVRCVTVDLPGADGLAADPGLLRTLGQVSDTACGLVVDVLRPGRVRVGDRLEPA